jgi:hypothetical protein
MILKYKKYEIYDIIIDTIIHNKREYDIIEIERP